MKKTENKNWYISSYASKSLFTTNKLQTELNKIIINNRDLFENSKLYSGENVYYLETNNPLSLSNFINDNKFVVCDKPNEEIGMLLGIQD